MDLDPKTVRRAGTINIHFYGHHSVLRIVHHEAQVESQPKRVKLGFEGVLSTGDLLPCSMTIGI